MFSTKKLFKDFEGKVDSKELETVKGKIMELEELLKPEKKDAAKIKEKMDKQIIEIVCNPVREAYRTIKRNTTLEVQMFGDRINVIVENYKPDLIFIKKMLAESKVQITDERIITPSLENVFMHLIEDSV